MFKGKHALAAVLMFVSGAALASNFRVADQVYLPAAGHFTGTRGETWATDVWISNVNAEAVDISVIYASGAGGTQQPFDKLFTLAASEHREINDFFVASKASGGLGLSSGALGQLIFNGCKSGGNCDVTTCPGSAPGSPAASCPDFRNISVEARVWAIPANSGSNPPTYGQMFSGIPWYNFISTNAQAVGLDKVFITGLRNTGGSFGVPGTFRTNIGLVNASQYSTTQLVVKLFDGKTGNQVATYTTPGPLGPLGQQLLPIGQMFPTFTGSTATNDYVTVEQISVLPTSDAAAAGCSDGCPAFLAYGSLIDNGSDDATTLEPQYITPLSDAAQLCIYNATCKGSFKPRRAVRH